MIARISKKFKKSKVDVTQIRYIHSIWLRGKDLNLRPPGYEPDELPTALPRDVNFAAMSIIAHATISVKLFMYKHIRQAYMKALLGKCIKTAHMRKLRIYGGVELCLYCFVG